MEKDERDYSEQELIKRYNIDIKKLESEQLKLSKAVSLEDSMNFSSLSSAAGIYNSFFRNKIISAIVVLDAGFEVLDEQYVVKKAEFPYISGFRAYRELPAMLDCLHKLQGNPDVVFIEGHGILHPRNFGIASHFGVSADVASIGVSQSILSGDVKGAEIFINNKRAGYSLVSKEGSNPIYISPGHKISAETALELTKRFTVKPHKLPEPLVIARKYSKRIMNEIVKAE